METITLHDISGFAKKSGFDAAGNCWMEFQVDYFALQEAGECTICGKVLDAGWLCLDGGDEVCETHIEIA